MQDEKTKIKVFEILSQEGKGAELVSAASALEAIKYIENLYIKKDKELRHEINNKSQKIISELNIKIDELEDLLKATND